MGDVMRFGIRVLARLGLLVAGVWLFTACTPPAAQQFLVVDTTNDTVDALPGDGLCADAAGDCSLRAAVMEGNTTSGTTEVQVAAGETYVLTIPGRDEDAGATGDLDFLQRTYIRAPIGAAPATIDANGLDRVIDARAGSFHFLEGLVITGGDAVGAGGGVRMLTGLVGIEDTRVTGNSASVNGGGVWAGQNGTLWLEDSTVDNNVAGDYGGGIFARTNVFLFKNTTLHANVGTTFDSQVHQESGNLTAHFATITSDTGPALVYQHGNITLTNSVVSGSNDCAPIGLGTLTSSGTVFSDTSCSPSGTDLVDSVTLLGPLTDNGGPVPTRMPYTGSAAIDSLAAAQCASNTFDARQQPRPYNTLCDAGAVELQVDEAQSLFVVDTTADTIDASPGDGQCADVGGACSLRAAVMEGNTSTNLAEIVLTGGATYGRTIPGYFEDAAAAGDLDISEDTIIRVAGTGQATVDANGLDRVFDVFGGHTTVLRNLVITGGLAGGFGGGIFVSDFGGTPTVTVEGSRVTDNDADDGGGIANLGATVAVFDSTIDNNDADFYGGGIYVDLGSDVSLSQVTVTENTAGSVGPQVWNNGSLTVAWSTLVGADALVQDSFASAGSVSNSVVSGCVFNGGPVLAFSGSNVVADGSCGTGPNVTVAPLGLLALADNGGPAPTMMPYANSPVVDATACGALTADARGEARPVGANCDIGAVEAQADEAPDLFVVDTTADTIDASPGDGQCADVGGACSLRAAGMEGNASANLTEIVLTGGVTYGLTIAGDFEDAAATGDLDISEDTIIRVAGAGQATVDANGLDRVFDVFGGTTAVLRNLVITGGLSGGFGGGIFVSDFGGAPTVTVEGSRITDNGAGDGGGIANVGGTVSVFDSTIDNNNADFDGGGIFVFASDVSLSQVTVTENTAGNVGPQVLNVGSLTVVWSTLVGADAFVQEFFATAGSVSNSVVSGCTLETGAPVLAFSGSNVVADGSCGTGPNVTVAPLGLLSLTDNGGPVPTMMPYANSPVRDATACGALTADARGEARPFGANCDVGAVEAQAGEGMFVVDTTNDTVDAAPGDGQCADAAGACSLRAAVMEGNTSAELADIVLTAGTTYGLTITGSGEDAAATGDLDLLENTAIRVAGTGQATVSGGGFFDRVFDVRAGTDHELRNLNITGGFADFGVGVGEGGGVMASGTVTLTMIETEVHGNHAGFVGGGIAAKGTATVNVANSTIRNNTADQYGAGISVDGGATLDLFQTTIAGNDVLNFTDVQVLTYGTLNVAWSTINGGAGLSFDLNGSTVDVQHSAIAGSCLAGSSTRTGTGNLWGDAACAIAGDVTNTPMNVGGLAFNGGPVQTMLPNVGSPLLDAGGTSCAAFDARGLPRPYNTNCDIGAVEAQAGEAGT